jgi:hypothetical protein
MGLLENRRESLYGRTEITQADPRGKITLTQQWLTPGPISRAAMAKNKLRIMHVESGVIYDSMTEAAIAHKMTPPSVCQHCKSGNVFRYVDQGTHNKKKVCYRPTGEIYESAHHASKAHGISADSIRHQCAGRTKTQKFYYVEAVKC